MNTTNMLKVLTESTTSDAEAVSVGLLKKVIEAGNIVGIPSSAKGQTIVVTNQNGGK